MENYIIALLAYALVFGFAHFIGLKKSSKKSQLKPDYILTDMNENLQKESEIIETKSVA